MKLKNGVCPKGEEKNEKNRIKIEHQKTDKGLIYVGKTISDKGRLLGVARFELPVSTRTDLIRIYGPELTEQIILGVLEDMTDRFGKAAEQVYTPRCARSRNSGDSVFV